jgi:hypothetical protein
MALHPSRGRREKRGRVSLRGREQKDYLDRIESNVLDYTVEKFHDKRHKTGTVAMIENAGKRPGEVCADYKTRGEVETMIDALKNVADADRTYIQDEDALEGWVFINLIALKWYYAILNLLKKHKLDSKYSPTDFIRLKKVKINNEWHDAEITRKTKDLLETLNIIPIT